MANCGCPPGYVLDQNGNCVGTSSVPPIISPTAYTVEKAPFNYGNFAIEPAQFIEDITNKPWPILSYAALAPSGNLTSRYTDNNAVPLIVTNTLANNAWGGSGSPGLSRMYIAGVWTNSLTWDPINEWIGFNYCFTLTETKTYYVAYAVDDFARIFIDGVLMLNQDTSGWAFRSMQIFPITLSAGQHIITGEVKNAGASAIFAFEIYNATLAQLLAAVNASDIDPYVVFSSGNQVGFNWTSGTATGISCPNGYTLDACNSLLCTQTVIVPQLPCCFLLESCDGSIADILVNNDLSAFVDTVIQVCPENIPSGGGSGTGSGVPIEIIDNTNTVWDLHDCCGLLPPVRVESYLVAYNGGIIMVPSLSLTTCWRVEKSVLNTLPITSPDLRGGTYYADCPTCQSEFPCIPTPPITLTECKCFTVRLAQGCQGSITLLNPQIIPNFATCDLCEPKCYYLIDCTDPNNFILTDDQDLAPYLGQVVQLRDCPNTCWQVLLSDTCDNSTCIQDVIAVFEDCKTCLPPVPEIPAKSLAPRIVKPGYYTPGCSPEYTEKVNCSFATQIYNIMLIKRYGLTICCEEDQINWQIKKQLLDFKALYDPELCKCFINSCCPPTCVEAELNVFNPTVCAPPTNVVPLLSMPCLPPTNVVPLLNYPVLVRCGAPTDVRIKLDLI